MSSRLLLCGCLAGLYETYDNEIVGIVDARGAGCADPAHEPGHTLALDAMNVTAESKASVAIPHTPPR